MSKTDEPLKKLFKNKENSENIHIQENSSKEHEIHVTKRYRDLCMQYDDEILQIILGCEDQQLVDYAMPVRTMLYDALAYTEQKNNLELKQKNDGSYYRGKLSKDQKLLPVLSLVFYYGDIPWDAGKSIHDMIKWSKEFDIKDLIPDYKMNMIWAYNVDNIDQYKSDLQHILHMLEYKQDKEKLRNYITKNDKELQAMPQDSHNAIVALLGNEMFEGIEKSKKGEIKVVSKALLDIKNEGKKEGIKEGITKGEILNLILLINKKYRLSES